MCSPHCRPAVWDQTSGKSHSGQQKQSTGTTAPTFVNEAHILLVCRREDLAAVGGGAGTAVPLAVVDDSGDRRAGGSSGVRRDSGTGGIPTPTHKLNTHLVIAGCLVLVLGC